MSRAHDCIWSAWQPACIYGQLQSLVVIWSLLLQLLGLPSSYFCQYRCFLPCFKIQSVQNQILLVFPLRHLFLLEGSPKLEANDWLMPLVYKLQEPERITMEKVSLPYSFLYFTRLGQFPIHNYLWFLWSIYCFHPGK